MNFIHDLWMLLVFQPQLNAIQYFFNLTQDSGVALLILTILINLPLWPLMGKNYLISQKMRYLQPKIRAIQELNKENPAEMMKKMGEFNKTHNIGQSGIFKFIFLQLIVVQGVYWVSRAIGENPEPSGQFGLYQQIFKTTQTNINQSAFKSIDLAQPATNYWYLLVINFVFTFALGWYTFKILPKIPMAVPKDETEEKRNQRESMEKSSEFIGIWLSPILILGFNTIVPAGVGIYFAAISVLALLRQYVVANYYRTHVKDMIENALELDPSITDQEILDVENLIEVESSPISDGTVEPKKSKGKPKKNRR